jgi:hypothetical protein
MILDQIISIKRLQKDANNSNKEQYVDNVALSEVKCQIQPSTAEETALSDGVFGQSFTMYTATSGILTGDHITVSGTNETFRVKGIEDWSQIDLIPHFEIFLVRMEEDEVIA